DTIVFEKIRYLQDHQSVILMKGINFLTLEMVERMFGLNEPGIGVYRANDTAVLDGLETWGRVRSNQDMIDRKDLNGLIRALKK
ncbi:LpxL/LpxP family acyltransferase, partial [Klebsiella pneumoniae]|uniref:LpxL/LpxP family acyltransferase n=1 Tax=Klebsiella pneumoniae TaxID=573 RepID=UPI00276830D6|nr:lipid A biosynthesis lauroyl acyltransferase [Klebsiella pneumoniae]